MLIHMLKPTRLWYLTGKKHFQYMLEKRENCCCGKGHVRPRNDLFMLYGLYAASAIGVLYAFGGLSPRKDCKELVDALCEKKDKEEKSTCPANPCPEEVPPKPPSPCC